MLSVKCEMPVRHPRGDVSFSAGHAGHVFRLEVRLKV